MTDYIALACRQNGRRIARAAKNNPALVGAIVFVEPILYGLISVIAYCLGGIASC